jgi:hypothetical protein
MNNTVQQVTDLVKARPLLIAGLALLFGFLLGWFGMGWGLWPVEFVDANVAQLRSDYKQDYVRLVAAEYALTGDLDSAETRINALGEDAPLVISDTVGTSVGEDAFRVLQLQQILEVSGRLPDAGEEPGAGEQSLLQRYQLPLLLCSLALVLILAAGGGFVLWSSGAFGRGPRGGGGVRVAPSPAGRVGSTRGSPRASSAATLPRAEPAGPGAATPTGGPPVAQFMTTYVLGDDLYDDSFSIDSPDGSFLGECGMGISETIGVGDPKKVMAFEVWLFDKNDIRTVTKVLMSEHAFRDEALKSRLAAKGEPVLVSPGDVVSMETAALVVTARVVDMAYGGGALPPNSFFERLTIELAAYTKAPAA